MRVFYFPLWRVEALFARATVNSFFIWTPDAVLSLIHHFNLIKRKKVIFMALVT